MISNQEIRDAIRDMEAVFAYSDAVDLHESTDPKAIRAAQLRDVEAVVDQFRRDGRRLIVAEISDLTDLPESIVRRRLHQLKGKRRRAKRSVVL